MAIAACLVLLASAAQAEEETVGLWIKNTSPAPVTVTIDGQVACRLEAPAYVPCQGKISKLEDKKVCANNALKMSCITNVKAAGADVALKRGDGIEYKVRAAKDGGLYLCVEPAALTDCFGQKLQ
jgi:hypothetical protein